MIFPSGPASLFTNFFKANEWNVIGCVSPEERSTALLDFFQSRGVQCSTSLLSIQPENLRHPWSDPYQTALAHAEKEATNSGLQYERIALMASNQTVVELFDSIVSHSSCESLLIDISALPKRFFFPLLKRLVRKDNKFKDIVVAYTGARTYPSGKLSDATDPIGPLPLFSGAFDDRDSQLFISAGFEPHSLPDFSRSFKITGGVEVLFPFPPGPPHYFKSLDFLRTIEKELGDAGRASIVVKEIDPTDVGGHLSYLYQATNNGSNSATLAPFGPKPVSLAMALHAMAYGSQVVYSQPRVYNPEYSSGVSQFEGGDNIQVYGLKLGGKIRVEQWQIAAK